MKARGASNINPCPNCGHTWFTVENMEKTYWDVICEKCGTPYIKMINKTIIPNVDPIRGYE